MGQFNPTATKTEQPLKVFIHEPSSLNDHFLSVADVVGEYITTALSNVLQDLVGNERSSVPAFVTFL
jgi:hypothetical protein